MMRYRDLGTTGIRVSVLGMGSSPFRYGTPEQCAKLVEQAYKCGINYYDTARSYVNGENTISLLPSDIKDGLVITTKTGARGGTRCVSDLHTSLQTLDREYIDIWMTHMIETEEEYRMTTELGGFCDIAKAAKKAGLIRAFGASFHAPTSTILNAIENKTFDVVMFQLNIIGRETVFGESIRSYRNELLPSAEKKSVGVVVMKVLAGGELRYGAPSMTFLSTPEFPHDTATSAVLYATLHPTISTAVVGMRSTEEVIKNSSVVSNFRGNELQTFKEWTSKYEDMAFSSCDRCGICIDHCPKEIEIPRIVRLFEQFERFGMIEVAKENYGKIDYTPSMCNGCNECNDVCHLGFDIPFALSRAHSVLGI